MGEALRKAEDREKWRKVVDVPTVMSDSECVSHMQYVIMWSLNGHSPKTT